MIRKLMLRIEIRLQRILTIKLFLSLIGLGIETKIQKLEASSG